MDYDDIMDILKQHLGNPNSDMKNSMNDTLQQVSQGDIVGAPTPAQQKFYGNQAAMAMGSLGAGEGAAEPAPRAAEDSPEVAALRKNMNDAVDSGSDITDVAQNQQAMNRQMDFENRAKAQKYARTVKTLGR